MRRDSKAFRERFLRWKAGEAVYDAGKPIEHYADGREGIYDSRYDAYEGGTLPEITVTGNAPKRGLYPVKYKFNPNKWVTARTKQADFGDIAKGVHIMTAGLDKMVDPTGILNLPQAVNSVKYAYNNPTVANFIDAGISVTSALPYVGKVAKIINSGLKVPSVFRIPGNIMAMPGRKVINSIGQDAKGILNALGLNVTKNVPVNSIQNVATLGARMYEDPQNKFIVPIVTNILEHTGGRPALPYLDGPFYSGSYSWPIRRLSPSFIRQSKSSFGGKNADESRNLVKLYMTGDRSGFDVLNYDDSVKVGNFKHYGTSYVGKILPIKNDSSAYKLPIEMKAKFDDMIKRDRPYFMDGNNILVGIESDKDFDRQTLDNVRTFILKPGVDKSGNYYLDATKVWDFAGTTGLFGDILESFHRKHNLPKAPILKLRVNVEFVPENYTTESADILSAKSRRYTNNK